MLLWLHSAVRNWQRHRFVTALLLAGYAVGISLSTLVFAAISGAAANERDLAFGDPARTLSAVISGDKELTLDLDASLQGIPVSWGWVYIPGSGGRLDPDLAETNIIALFGEGEFDWKPPLRSGRFLTGRDVQQGQKLLVRGDEVYGSPSGFQVIGVAFDPPQGGKGWSRDVFVPLLTLPSEIRQKSSTLVSLHLEVPPGQDPAQARAALGQNLSRQYPGSYVEVETMADQYARLSERYRQAYNRGFGFSAMILGFVAANVAILSVHWLTQRRREIGVRIALGAAHADIIAMVLTEHLLLAGIGAVLSVPVMLAASKLATRLELSITISPSVLLVTLASTILGGILSSAPPLYLFFRAPLRENLHYRD